MIDAWKWNSLAKIVYTDNIRFFQKNVFNPNLKSAFSIFLLKSTLVWFFQKHRPVSCNSSKFGTFSVFFITKSHSYIAFFWKKTNDTGGKKVGKKSSTRIYTGISTFFCPKPLLQNHAQYPIFCIFFQKYKGISTIFLQKSYFYAMKTKLKSVFFQFFFIFHF